MLLFGGIASVVASVPQLVKLLRLKHSVEFNLFSWTVWLLYQCISVAYTIYIGARIYAVINGLWVCFYAIMVFLIIRYRPATKKTASKRPSRN